MTCSRAPVDRLVLHCEPERHGIPLAAAGDVGDRQRHVVHTHEVSLGPIVLHDHTLADHLAGEVTDVGLVAFIGHVSSGRSEVGEVHHRNGVEVPLEMSGVVGEPQTRQLRYRS